MNRPPFLVRWWGLSSGVHDGVKQGWIAGLMNGFAESRNVGGRELLFELLQDVFGVSMVVWSSASWWWKGGDWSGSWWWRSEPLRSSRHFITSLRHIKHVVVGKDNVHRWLMLLPWETSPIALNARFSHALGTRMRRPKAINSLS